MASNFKAKRQKLYFDITFNKLVTSQTVNCTQFSNGTPGDRYGGLLTALAALTGSSPSGNKAKAAVSAWFVPNFVSVSNATTPPPLFGIEFVQPTANGAGKNARLLPYLTAGTLTPLANLSGHEAIYSITAGTIRHFAVRVRRQRTAAGAVIGGAASVVGTLVVQRQHTIEV